MPLGHWDDCVWLFRTLKHSTLFGWFHATKVAHRWTNSSSWALWHALCCCFRNRRSITQCDCKHLFVVPVWLRFFHSVPLGSGGWDVCQHSHWRSVPVSTSQRLFFLLLLSLFTQCLLGFVYPPLNKPHAILNWLSTSGCCCHCFNFVFSERIWSIFERWSRIDNMRYRSCCACPYYWFFQQFESKFCRFFVFETVWFAQVSAAWVCSHWHFCCVFLHRSFMGKPAASSKYFLGQYCFCLNSFLHVFFINFLIVAHGFPSQTLKYKFWFLQFFDLHLSVKVRRFCEGQCDHITDQIMSSKYDVG